MRTLLVTMVALPQAAGMGMGTGDPLGAVHRLVTVDLVRGLRHRAVRMGVEGPGAVVRAEAGRRAMEAVRVRQATVAVRALPTTEVLLALGMRTEVLETVLQAEVE